MHPVVCVLIWLGLLCVGRLMILGRTRFGGGMGNDVWASDCGIQGTRGACNVLNQPYSCPTPANCMFFQQNSSML